MILTNATDLLGGRPFSTCPPIEPGNSLPSEFAPGIFNASISIVYFLQALFCGFVFILIPIKYDNVRIFGRNLHSNYISNRLWIWFFFLNAVCAAIDGTRYVLNTPYYIFTDLSPTIPPPQDPIIYRQEFDQRRRNDQYRNVDSGLLLASTVLRALVLLFLSLALQWQFVQRCAISPVMGSAEAREQIDSDPESETTALLQRFSGGMIRRDSEVPSVFSRVFFLQKRGKKIFRCDRLSMILFVMALLTLYLNITPIPLGKAFFFLFIAVFATLQIPIIVLMAFILFSPTSSSSSHSVQNILSQSDEQSIKPEGPTSFAKLVLFSATIMNFANILPPSIISLLFHVLSHSISNQYFGIVSQEEEESGWIKCFPLFSYPAFSLIDIVNFIALLSNIFYFVFLRVEFGRVKARTIWWTVRRVTGTFGFNSHSQ